MQQATPPNRGIPGARRERQAARGRCAFALLICAAGTTLPTGAGAAGYLLAGPAPDRELFLRSTHLIDLEQGSALSRMIRGNRRGGFETSAGYRVDFKAWYESRWTDTRVAWLTQVSADFGVIWGFSTGERGKKYTIAPGMRIGFVYHAPVGTTSYLSVRATTLIGGRLKEKACAADYGEIGGVQKVNCRLAASVLPPSETLRHLYRESPPDRHVVELRYTRFF